MKNYILYLTLLLAPCVALAQSEAYVSEENHFQIDFPEQPFIEKDTVHTDVGILDIYIYTAEDAESVFMMSLNEYPEGFLDFEDDETVGIVLEETANAVGENFGTDIGAPFLLESNEAFVYQEKHQGRSFKGQAGQLYVVGRYIMIENKLFQMMIITMGQDSAAGKAEDFFNSFKLLD